MTRRSTGPDTTGSETALRRWSWLLVAVPAVLIYSLTFMGTDVVRDIETANLLESDSAAFAILIPDFDPSRAYGDEWEVEERGLDDLSQKHKLHHAPYVFVGTAIYTPVARVRQAMGLAPGDGLYLVNPILALLNLWLVWILLRHFGVAYAPRLAILILYAFALSTWLFNAVLGSWPLAGACVLGFLWLHERRRWAWWRLALVVGAMMSLNVLLYSLLMWPGLRLLVRRDHGWAGALSRIAGMGVVGFATWALVMFALSAFDHGFRPDEFLRYSAWWSQYLGYDIPPTDPYVWKVIVSNMFFTGIVAYQGDPTFPQDAIRGTLSSAIGLVGTLTWGLVLGWMLLRAGAWLRSLARRPTDPELLDDTHLHIAVYVLFWAVMTLKLYNAAFVYAPLTTPLLMLLLGRCIRWESLAARVTWIAAIAVILGVNVLQVLRLRDWAHLVS